MRWNRQAFYPEGNPGIRRSAGRSVLLKTFKGTPVYGGPAQWKFETRLNCVRVYSTLASLRPTREISADTLVPQNPIRTFMHCEAFLGPQSPEHAYLPFDSGSRSGTSSEFPQQSGGPESSHCLLAAPPCSLWQFLGCRAFGTLVLVPSVAVHTETITNPE